MKKLFFNAIALVSLFFAASCQQENLEPVNASNTVTYTVQVPDVVATKALGDDVTPVNELVYEVYRTEGERVTTFTNVDNLLYHRTAPVNNGVATITLELVNDQNFTVLFWAQTKVLEDQTPIYNVDDLTNVTVSRNAVANNVNAAAFVGRDFIINCVSDSDCKVTLTRPVSQLNIATTQESLKKFNDVVVLEGSSVVVKGLSQDYNVATLTPGELNDNEYTYTETIVPTYVLKVGETDYVYVGMNYLGFAPQLGATVTVSYMINTTEGDIDNVVENVPVKPNYRTNIIGNLITSTTDYEVKLDKEFSTNGNSGNIVVLAEGIVRNMAGDYEITTANGLAYAMNKGLFANGGDFYLTEPVYDMVDYNVVASSVPSDKTLNIYGETPVVTRASATVGGVTITGLEGALIDTIFAGANVSISGVNMPDNGSVLVNNNQGKLVVSESSAKTIVANGNKPIKADEVSDLPTLLSVLASDVKVINLAADIEASEFISISRSVTINGNGHKLISSASRIIRFQMNKGIEVVFNNLHGVSTAKFVYGVLDSIRGFSVDPEVWDATLTFNDCSVEFTDPTSSDWSYAINIVTSENNTIVINGGTYEGANVINVWGDNHTIKVNDATLSSKYLYNNLYTGCCFRFEGSNNKVEVKNSTFNGSHAVPVSEKNEGANTIVFENCIDNTMSKYVDENEVTYYSVSSSATLEAAICADAVKADKVILLSDGTYSADLMITVAALGTPEQKNLIIRAEEGATPVVTGTITLGYYENRVGAEQWESNITFDGITFDHAEAANHSLSIQNVKGLNLVNCTIVGDGEYGISAPGNNPTGPSSISNCSFVNAGLQLGGNFATGLVIDECSFDESCVNVQGGNSVTIQNCNFENTLTNAHVGQSFYLIRSNATPITVKNCAISIDSELSEVAAAQENWGILWNRKNLDWTVENVAVSMTDAALRQTQLLVTKCTSTGKINTNNLTVNGKAYASTAAQLTAAVNNGATDIVLAGEFDMPSNDTKNAITFTSLNGTAVIDNTKGSYWENATLTFNNISFKTGTGMVNGNGADYAALYSKNVTYNSCTFTGPMRLGRDGAKFNACTFNGLGNDYIWTYGNSVSFDGCTFNTDGKAILIYSDGPTYGTNGDAPAVSVTNCTFNATQGAKAGAIANQNCAAVEIHNYGNGVTLTTSGNTIDEEFSGVWRIKTYENRFPGSKIFVNGTEYKTIALDGKEMTIGADKNVTVL